MQSVFRLALAVLVLAAYAQQQQTTYRITTAAGQDPAGDGGPALAAKLLAPEGLAFDASGNLFVTDPAAARVRRLAAGGQIDSISLPGIHLSAPYGITVDRTGTLSIADFGNRRVIALTSNGSVKFNSPVEGPRNLAADARGNVYVTDLVSRRVLVIDTATGAATSLAALAGAFDAPTGIAVAADATALYIADSATKTVRKVSGNTISTVVEGLASPLGLALGADGTLWIADGTGNRIVRRSAAGEVSSIAVGAPVRDVAIDPNGAPVFSAGRQVFRLNPDNSTTPVAGNGLEETASTPRLSGPIGLAVDDAGNLYIAEEPLGRVRRFSPSGDVSVVLAGARDPVSVAVNPLHGIRVTDHAGNRIQAITPAGVVYTACGDGEPGFRGDNGPATSARLNRPRGIAFDRQGNLYVADTGNHRVRRIGSNGIVTTVAGNGEPGFSGDGGQAVRAQLNGPQGVWVVDADGAVLIADTGNNAIRRVSADGVVETLASGLNAPSAVAVDSAGGVLVADTFQHRIRRISANGLETVAGIGAPGLSGDGGPAVAAQLATPTGLAVDASGSIFIADLGNHRIRKLTAEAVASPGPAATPRIDTVATADIRHAATLQPGPIAPGQLITLFGAFGATASAEVRVNAEPAQVIYANAAQINMVVPRSLTQRQSAAVEVFQNGGVVARALTGVVASSPGLFDAVVNEDGSRNAADAAATRGSVVKFYATGEGLAGSLSLSVGGIEAAILTSDSPSPGVLRIAARMPGVFTPPGARTAVLSAEGIRSPAVTVHLK